MFKKYLTHSINKSRFLGINLIGLIIGSALGVFILSVIIKVSFTVSNDYQIIKAQADLAITTRFLDSFLRKVFSANGYKNSGISDISNQFEFNRASNQLSWKIKFDPGIAEAVLCTGQPAVNVGSSGIVELNFISSANGITCTDNINPQLSIPIISSQQFYKAFMVVAAQFYNGSYHIKNTFVSNLGHSWNIPTGTLEVTGDNPVAIKLAIILKSKKPVFNIARNYSFNIFDNTVENINSTKFLHKLVIIQVPFFYTTRPGSTATALFIQS